MKYTDEQIKIIKKAIKWYKYESEQVFQIAGIAGAGKSVVLNAIVNNLKIPKERIAPMAYIGQAAIVMRMKGLYNAKTIHSWLFEPVKDFKKDKKGNIVYNNYLNRPKIYLTFKPKELNNIDLIIVDEAGTVPKSLCDEINSRNIKVIACGDLCQLPPIYGTPGYLKYGKIHKLTHPMRQSYYSGLYYISNRARLGLDINNGFYGDCLVIYEDELNNDMIFNSDIIICGKNKTRDFLNNYIRKNILNIKIDIPVYGEKMVCRKNNWNVEVDGINLANGLIGNVLNNPGVDTFDGKTFKIDFKPNMLNSTFLNIPCDYNYLIANYKDKQKIKNNKYSKGEKFEFAYSITCHMSQGGQFNNGIYIEEYLNRDIQKNLNYTGITRFSNSIIYVKRKRKYYHFTNY